MALAEGPRSYSLPLIVNIAPVVVERTFHDLRISGFIFTSLRQNGSAPETFSPGATISAAQPRPPPKLQIRVPRLEATSFRPGGNGRAGKP